MKANEAMTTDVGKRALEEGWARGLWRFVYQNGRLPTTSESYDLVVARDKAIEASKDISPSNPHFTALKALWDKFEEHEMELQNRYG